MNILSDLVAQFGMGTLLAIFAAAILTSCIHGAVGVAGGFLMTAALAQLIGVKVSVPVMSIALVISHSARTLLNAGHFNWRPFAAIMAPAVPMVLLSAYLYVQLPVRAVALVLAVIIFTSIPMRHWAKSRSIRAGNVTLGTVGAGYGFLAGASIGSGMLLSPFLLGYGLVKESFVATMAGIALATNVVRIGMFGTTDLLTVDYAVLGVVVGLIMIPGNWAGRTVLRRMAAGTHGRLVDFFAVIGGLNFLYLAVTA